MAKNDQKIRKNRISGLVSGIRSTMGGLYGRTYYSDPKVSKDLDFLTSSINKNIDRITSNNIDNIGMPMISKMYSRLNLFQVQSDNDVINSIQNVFGDNVLMDSVMSTYMGNRYLRQYDEEIDVVCKYMPKLLEALDTRKDNVLSADHFSKEYLNVKNKSSIDNQKEFSERIENIKKTYNLYELVDQIYDDTARYGECFVYTVPYKKALEKLLSRKDTSNTITGSFNIGEAAIRYQDQQESPRNMDISIEELAELRKSIGLSSGEQYKLNIEFNTSNLLSEAVISRTNSIKKMKAIKENSVMSWNESSTGINKLIDDNLSFDKIDNERVGVSDGLVSNDKNTKIDDKFPGCIIKTLERDRVIPIYLNDDDICMGYYYLEIIDEQDIPEFNQGMTDPTLNLKSMAPLNQQQDNIKKDAMLKYISGQLSRLIDAKFINANQDLRKEIYMVLKHNDLFNTNHAQRINVTFIPPEDMFHVTFKKDKHTHRGISDLERALIPAKLYAELYVTNVIAIMTRGQDKRVYYVKQNVDTNISKLLINTINQIKKSNFGMRQIENINNMLNIIGRFNDYVIPTGPDGAPVQMEVMQGQNVEIKTDLMNMLEEMAVNSTDVPLEIIQARQSADYAIQLTMSNSKFLRKVYNRQAKYQTFLSPFITRLYNCEYNANDELDVQLAPPMFLNITNVNQVINNTKDYVNSMLETELADEEDEMFKTMYTKDLISYYLSSYIDVSKHEDIKKRARIKAAIKRKEDNTSETTEEA